MVVALPDFIGIGVARAGTTWIHSMLDSHPDVYTPHIRKEIRFFDRYFERGASWYESLFPSNDRSLGQLLGEFSPQYFHCPECPKRIAKLIPDVKLILMLRHPVDRAYSQYGLFVQRRNFRGSFEDFLRDKPFALGKGYYSRYLQGFLDQFERDAFLILLFEEAIGDLTVTKHRLARFLDIDPDRFPVDAGRQRVNPSSHPRMQWLSGFAASAARQLRRMQLEPVVDFMMRRNLHGVLARGDSLPPLDPSLRSALSQPFQREFERLEAITGLDLSVWREQRDSVSGQPPPDPGRG